VGGGRKEDGDEMASSKNKLHAKKEIRRAKKQILTEESNEIVMYERKFRYLTLNS